MDTSLLFLTKILHTLAGRYGMCYTLEELTSILNPVLLVSSLADKISTEKENQAKVLEALILLNDDGLIFLNSDTDKSSITIKGLIKANNTVFCN